MAADSGRIYPRQGRIILRFDVASATAPAVVSDEKPRLELATVVEVGPKSELKNKSKVLVSSWILSHGDWIDDNTRLCHDSDVVAVVGQKPAARKDR